MKPPATFCQRAESLGMKRSKAFPDMFLRDGVGIYIHGSNGRSRIRVNWQGHGGVQGRTFYTGQRGFDSLIDRAFNFAEGKLKQEG